MVNISDEHAQRGPARNFERGLCYGDGVCSRKDGSLGGFPPIDFGKRNLPNQRSLNPRELGAAQPYSILFIGSYEWDLLKAVPAGTISCAASLYSMGVSMEACPASACMLSRRTPLLAR